MPHYYENDADLPSKPRELQLEIRGRVYHFNVDSGVFSKHRLDMGSQLLIDSLAPVDLGATMLDLGCGYGPIGIILADMHPKLRVLMVDINIRAVTLARSNIDKHRLNARVEALVSDGFQNVVGTFDTIVTNPPIRAGKKVIYRFYEEAKQHLNKEGSLYLVIRKDQGAASSYEFLTSIYRHVTRLERHHGYHVYQAHD